MEKIRKNISPAVRDAMHNVEEIMAGIDVDSLDNERRESHDRIVKKYDQAVDFFEKSSMGRAEIFAQRKKILLLCSETAEQLMKFTSLSHMIAAELARSIGEIPHMPRREDYELAYTQNMKTRDMYVAENDPKEVCQKGTCDIMVKAKKNNGKRGEINITKDMVFENPIQKKSQERNDDLQQELQEIQKKIDRVTSALHARAMTAGEDIVKKEELGKYEKQKTQLLQRIAENDAAEKMGHDVSGHSFAYQQPPIDRARDADGVRDVNTVSSADRQTTVMMEDANIRDESQTAVADPVANKNDKEDAVVTTILPRDGQHDGKVGSSEHVPTHAGEKVKNAQTTELVDDPDAAALGGFDRGKDVGGGVVESKGVEQKKRGTKKNFDTDMNEKEKFDREVARRAMEASAEKSRDTDMNEKEKFDREVERRENEQKIKKEEEERHKKESERQQRLAEAQKVLDSAREMYVVKKRRGETAMNKIRSLLGLNAGANRLNDEIKQLEEEYLSAQRSYNAILAERSVGLGEEEQRKTNSELRRIAFAESQAMYDAESRARLETTMGSIGNKIHKVGLWYRNLPKSVKYGAAIAMLGAGIVTGGAGFAGAAVGTAAVAKRFFGAAAVGAGVGMALDARVNAKRQKEQETALEQFNTLTVEKQKEILAGIDRETLERYGKMQTSRRRVKFAGISAAAAVLVGGKAVSATWQSLDGDAMLQKATTLGEQGMQKISDIVGDKAESGSDLFGDGSVISDGMVEDPNADLSDPVVTDGWFANNSEYGSIIAEMEKNGFANTQALAQFKEEYGKEAFEDFLRTHPDLSHEDAMSRWNRVMVRRSFSLDDRVRLERQAVLDHDIAKKMGFDSSKLSIVREGGVPVEINGKKVPMEMLTEEQKKLIEVARSVKAAMIGDSPVEKPEISNIAGSVSTVPSFNAEDIRTTMAQSDASEMVDNPDNAISVLTKMQGIAIDEKTGMGTIVVEKGGNYTKALAVFLEKNNELLTDGKMGWDATKYRDVHDWAMRRATVLANEYRAAHPGIDLDFMRPGTEIRVDLANLADIKTDVDFAGGPHIVPQNVKIEMMPSYDDAAIAHEIGMSQEVYEVSKGMPLRDYAGDLRNHTHKSAFEVKLLQYLDAHPEKMSGETTLGDFMQKNMSVINAEDHESPIDVPEPSAEALGDAVMENSEMSAVEIARQMQLPEFRHEMATQTQKLFGAHIANIHNAKVQFLAEHNPALMDKLTAIGRDSGITFNKDTKVNAYVARIAAKSMKRENFDVV